MQIETASPITRLSAEKISKRFGRNHLFDGLSFKIEPGRILGITGPNGSGKSTLLRILAGVMAPDSGTVTLISAGKAVEDMERPLATGFVAPYLNLYDALTARENLTFLANIRGISNKAERVSFLIDFVELSPRADDLVGTFSTGMKHRMRFAAALMGDPPLLLLDEPTSNLDAPGLAMVERLISRQLDAGRLIAIATNDDREVGRCDEILSLGGIQRPAVRSA